MILFVSINFDDLKRNSHELKKKRNNDLKLTPLLPRQQFVFPLLTPPLPRALNKLTNISASSQPKRLGPFFSGWHHPTRRDDFPFWKMHDPSLPQPPSPPQSKPSSLVAGYFWIMDTVVASVCPRNNRVLIPTRSCPPLLPTKYNENVFLQTTYRGRIRESTRDPRMENDPAVIAPRLTRGNGNRGRWCIRWMFNASIGYDINGQLCRRIYVLHGPFLSKILPNRSSNRSRSSRRFGKIFEFYCY